MKIAYLMNFAGSGGSEKYVKILSQAAKAQGHEIIFIYNIDGPLTDYMREQGYPCFSVPMRSLFDKTAVKQLTQLCKEHRVELMHVQFPRENYLALQVKKHCPGLRVLYTCHLLYPPHLIYRLLNQHVTKQDDGIIAVCHAVKKLLVQNGYHEGQIMVIHNAIAPFCGEKQPNDIRATLGIAPNDFLCVTLGRYTPEKGMPFLIEAMKHLSGQVKCIIVGEGPEYETVSGKIKEYGLEETVFQVGYRTNAGDYLDAADLALNSSMSEALSFAILEGMAKGLPTVATDIGGNGELLQLYRRCGEIVPYGADKAYAEAILKVKNNVELYKEYSENAKYCVQNYFNLDKMIADTMKVYTQRREKNEQENRKV